MTRQIENVFCPVNRCAAVYVFVFEKGLQVRTLLLACRLRESVTGRRYLQRCLLLVSFIPPCNTIYSPELSRDLFVNGRPPKLIIGSTKTARLSSIFWFPLRDPGFEDYIEKTLESLQDLR